MASEDRCVIGIDSGTSVVKAVAFDHSGNELASQEMPVQLLRQQPLWVEQDMQELWERVKHCLGRVIQDVKRLNLKISGIGITSTGDGTWMMDRGGNPVRNGMLWCDGRARKVVEDWHSKKIAEEAFEICGTSVFTGSQAAQLQWLRENEPEALKKASTIFHAKDWLFFKLTGIISSDETDESLTMLRMSTRQYDPELFRIFGIEDLYSKFPLVNPTLENIGPILPLVARDLDVPAGTLIGSGPMDVAACALGTGAIEHGQASSILGTAAIHQIVMGEPTLEPKMVGMTLCHGVRNRWIRMMAAMTATPNVDWFVKELGGSLSLDSDGSGENVYSRLEKIVSSVPAGAEGVIFHPYLFPGGERGPFVKPSARASFTGLSLNHSCAHLLRAVYEGVAFATLDCYRHMPIDPGVIFLAGGGSNSPVWCQIIADCVGKPTGVAVGSQFGAKGAAMNVGTAVGFYRTVEDAVTQSVKMGRFYQPDPSKVELYRQLYAIYKEMAERQMDLWDNKARIFSNGE
jgi:erythritol kinase (D-erythritol 1-phosphate-forming)